MKIKLKNWQDERGSALDRAKKIVTNKGVSLKDLSEITEIKRQTLANYRQKPDSLDKSQYRVINRLAQAYDAISIAQNMAQEDLLIIQSKLHKMFNELRKIHEDNSQELITINDIEKIVTSDPNAVYKIYKDLVKGLKD